MDKSIVLSINLDELSEQIASKMKQQSNAGSCVMPSKLDLSGNSEKQYYSVKEFCELLGISRVTLYNWRKSGLISYRRIGKRVFISKNDLSRSLSRVDMSEWQNISKQLSGGRDE